MAVVPAGGTTEERFVQHLKEMLHPTLRPDDTVVMDNIRFYHVKTIRKILEAKGMKVLHLLSLELAAPGEMPAGGFKEHPVGICNWDK